jgi:hypothetical protein
MNMTGQDQVAKTGREPFDLRFNAVGHIDSGPVGDMAVGPKRMLTSGSA